MNKRAEKHLEMALGGNMNIATLKPLALIEIMTDFAKKEVESINYTRCCEELKELDDDNFDDWLIVNGYTVYKDHYMKGDQVFFESELIQKYNNEVMNL